MKESQNSTKVEYATGEYHRAWDNTVPKKLPNGNYEYVYRLFTKMINFLEQAKMTREIWNHYITMSPARLEDEHFEDYKVRQKFQKSLIKYRSAVKSFIFLNAIEDLKNKQIENGTTN